ncbi:glycosyl transferase family 1 [Beijerinckiaceae bacterium]|nr:glycosyl transferase family 1 [Beijerinckiaceae bacterium]
MDSLETPSNLLNGTKQDSQRGPSWWLLLRLALRDFRGGLRGFGIFLASIALGVAAITGVGSVSAALKDGLAQQGRAILGGDASFNLVQHEINAPERDFFLQQGRLSSVALMRAMARGDNGEAALVEIKAVDGSYPLAGELGLEPPLPLADALAEREGAFGIVAEAALLAKLGLSLGSRLTIGDTPFELRSVLAAEPDHFFGAIGFGPRVLISEAALRATGLLQPGALTKWAYRVLLNGATTSDSQLDAFTEAVKQKFPEAGWDVRTRKNISPQFSRNLDRFTEFLTLVGLTSLIVGGIGVANAIAGFVERKRPVIATLKAVGASGSTVFALMLTQTMLVALVGVTIGAALGAALPFVAVWGFGSLLPFPLAPAVFPTAIGKGVLYGLLTALAFSAGPLGHAHDVPVQALFRAEIEPRRTLPRPRYIALILSAAVGLASTFLVFATDRGLVLIYMAATLAAFAVLRGASFLIMFGAKKIPHMRNFALRLAIGNIYRPGALTPSVVLSLGLGVALLVTLTLIDGNISAELKPSLIGKTPSFYFLDVQNAKAGEFTAFLKSHAPDSKIELVPMLRGRIIRLNGLQVGVAQPKQSVAWVLEGDRGITFAPSLPEGSVLIKGAWWPSDYTGPPLVSMENEAAEGLGLAVGDEVTVNVLGREIGAKIANTRKVNWRSYGINFVLVFSPNSFAGAPFADLATLTFEDASSPARESSILRETARKFPSITSIRVKDALDTVNAVVAQLAFAVRGASSVAFLASILVLGGALAAGQTARIHDAVVLKTLGATRSRLLAAYIFEYSALGFCTALFGVAAGGAAAYAIVDQVMKLDFLWLWPQTFIAAVAAVSVTIGLGLLSTWWILGRKPAPYLRDL